MTVLLASQPLHVSECELPVINFRCLTKNGGAAEEIASWAAAMTGHLQSRILGSFLPEGQQGYHIGAPGNDVVRKYAPLPSAAQGQEHDQPAWWILSLGHPDCHVSKVASTWMPRDISSNHWNLNSYPSAASLHSVSLKIFRLNQPNGGKELWLMMAWHVTCLHVKPRLWNPCLGTTESS